MREQKVLLLRVDTEKTYDLTENLGKELAESWQIDQVALTALTGTFVVASVLLSRDKHRGVASVPVTRG